MDKLTGGWGKCENSYICKGISEETGQDLYRSCSIPSKENPGYCSVNPEKTDIRADLD